MSLNGVQVEDDLVFKWGKKVTVEKYKIKYFSNVEMPKPFLMPPLSILFLRYTYSV